MTQCNCKDNHQSGQCSNFCKGNFTLCYFCNSGHQVPEKDNDPASGSDEVGYQKGERIE